ERAGRFTALGVAQIRRDAAVLALELFDGVERRVPGEEGVRRVQPPAGDQQQWEAGANIGVVDPDVASLVERHGSPSSPGGPWCARRATGQLRRWKPR